MLSSVLSSVLVSATSSVSLSVLSPTLTLASASVLSLSLSLSVLRSASLPTMTTNAVDPKLSAPFI